MPCSRADVQTWTSHRNPLFDSRLGLVPQRMIVDALHCLFLGVVQRFCGCVIHQLLEYDAWEVGDAACKVQLGPSRVVAETDILPIDHDRARETEKASQGE